VYAIQYMVNLGGGGGGGNNGICQLNLSGTLIAGSIGSTSNTQTFGHQLVGSAIVSVAAGQSIGIQNIGSVVGGSFTLETSVLGTVPTSATLTLIRIGS
jgi:hypothetical protein